jgi:hypothetical protein
MSGHDVDAGDRWGRSLDQQLEESNLGVVCLTGENLQSLWLAFEAGALSKAFDASRVVPYRFGLTPSDVRPPLAQFQSVEADKNGTFSLVKSIHKAIGSALVERDLNITFERWWPDLEDSLSRITRRVAAERRTEREILEEVLTLVRRTGSREIQDTLGRILALPNVHSMKVMRVFKDKGFTGELLFQVMVKRKLPVAELSDGERIPEMVYGMPIKVVEVRNSDG